MPTPPARPDPAPLPDPAADTGLTGSEANKPGGGPQTEDGSPGAPRRKEQPDDGWVETGTSYGGLRTRVPTSAPSPPTAAQAGPDDEGRRDGPPVMPSGA